MSSNGFLLTPCGCWSKWDTKWRSEKPWPASGRPTGAMGSASQSIRRPAGGWVEAMSGIMERQSVTDAESNIDIRLCEGAAASRAAGRAGAWWGAGDRDFCREAAPGLRQPQAARARNRGLVPHQWNYTELGPRASLRRLRMGTSRGAAEECGFGGSGRPDRSPGSN